MVACLRSEQHCYNPVVIHQGQGAALVEFLAPSKHVPKLLKRLWSLGVTRSSCPYESRLSMQSVLASMPPLRTGESPRLLSRRSCSLFDATARNYSSHDRSSIDEILSNVDAESHLTFDFLALTTCAAVIAGVGLVTDAPVVVVSSMLISPLMKPIMCTSLGLAMGDWSATWYGLRNEAIGSALAFAVGLLAGCVLGPIIISTSLGGEWVLHSAEIEQRGDPVALIAGAILAAPSGVAVALCVTGGASAALVGVAISASLLPPLVNSGICLTLALASKLLWHHPLQTTNESADPDVFFRYAAVSIGVYFLNLFTVVLFSFLTFRWKQVSARAIDYLAEVWLPQPDSSCTRTAGLNVQHCAHAPSSASEGNRKADRMIIGASLRTVTDAAPGYGTAGKCFVNLTKAGL